MTGDIAKRDDNYVPAVQGVSSVDGRTLVDVWVNPSTHALLFEDSNVLATDSYSISDYDDSANPVYVGKVAANGSWFITSINTSTGSVRYIKGSANYSTSWTARTGLVYDYYSVIF